MSHYSEEKCDKCGEYYSPLRSDRSGLCLKCKSKQNQTHDTPNQQPAE